MRLVISAAPSWLLTEAGAQLKHPEVKLARSSRDSTKEPAAFCLQQIAHLTYSVHLFTMAPKEVPTMFKRKKDWLYLELNAEEKRLLRRAMLDFRNKVLAQNGPTEDIDRIILMLAR